MSLSDVLVEIFWFMLLVCWIYLLITILGDIFRDHSLSGGGKAGWTLLLIAVPWFGALMYLIFRGASMNERAQAQAERNQEAFQQYVRQAAAPSTPSPADELAKLADLRDRGAISDEEYQRAKSKALGDVPVASAPQQRDPRSASAST